MSVGSRYQVRAIYVTKNPLYAKDLKARGLNQFRFYETPRFTQPTAFEKSEFENVGHVWNLGDRYYKLAHEHYGDSELWWKIAWYNNKPTEAHVKIGEVINIPTPLWKVRAAYRV